MSDRIRALEDEISRLERMAISELEAWRLAESEVRSAERQLAVDVAERDGKLRNLAAWAARLEDARDALLRESRR